VTRRRTELTNLLLLGDSLMNRGKHNCVSEEIIGVFSRVFAPREMRRGVLFTEVLHVPYTTGSHKNP